MTKIPAYILKKQLLEIQVYVGVGCHNTFIDYWNKIPVEYQQTAYLDYCYEDDEAVRLFYNRLETDEEYKKRIEVYSASQAKHVEYVRNQNKTRKEREHREYLRLKKKFEK